MRKMAIFTEGQSELIFIRNILVKICDISEISFECLKLHAGEICSVPYKFSNPYAKVHYLIVNVQGDSNVVSAIKEREKKLIDDGFESILGLRDMYCEEYDKQSGGCIKEELTKRFIDGHQLAIKNMSYPDKINIFFSIMEIEAWFLTTYKIFEKINPTLTINFIFNKLNLNLVDINPEVFFRPSNIFKKIYQLCNMKYDKSEDEIEKISSKITCEDIGHNLENSKCESFKNFLNALKVS